jgi:hypothetical protein
VIDPPERIVAAIGIEAFLDGKVHLTRAHETAIQGMDAAIDRDVFSAIKGDREPHRDDEPFDIKAIGKQLADIGNREQLKGFHEAFLEAPPELSAAVQNIAGRIMRYLADHYPQRIRSTSIIASETKPSGVEAARFKRLWRIACDPLTVVRALASHSISRDMVRSLEDLYPSVYTAIRGAVIKAIGRIKGRRGGWIPSRTLDLQLRVLMQADTITPQLAAEIAQIPEATKIAQRRTQHSDSGHLQTQAQRLATPTQR